MLDELALFLDDEDFLQPFAEVAHAVRLQRPRHADLVELEAYLRRHRLVDAQLVQRLERVRIGLACRDDAEARLRAVPDHLVDVVGLGERQRREPLVELEAGVFLAPHVAQANVQAAFRCFKVRKHDVAPFVVQIDRRAGFHRIGRSLQADPAAREAGHGDAEQAILHILMHAGRIQERHERRLEIVIGLVRQRR